MPLKKSGGPIVGLDIGSSFIKACEVDVRGGRANLRGIAVLPTPPDAIVNNEIVDPVALGKALKQLLQGAGIKAKKVITCVQGQSSLVVRIIEVPKMTRAELQETMKWEIERHVPFAAEQVVMDYQPLVPPEEVPEGENMEVLLAVAQEALVTRHVEAIQAAGLAPVAIDIEPLAAARSLLDLANGSGPTGTVAVVDVGASTTDISIYRDGRIAFTRSIQLAGNNLTKAISDVLGQPLADAEELKKRLANIPELNAPDAGGMGGIDPFGNDEQFGGLDFGMGDAGNPMGGTFGMAPPADPGASTAADDDSATQFDIAGSGGLTADMFTSGSDPAPADATLQPGAPGGDAADSIFGQPAAAPIENLDPSLLSGPVPAANPFDVAAHEVPQPAAAPAPAAGPDPGAAGNPFDMGLFGATPGADPFAPIENLGDLGGGAPAPDFGASTTPAAMSEEDYLRTQVSDAIMPVFHELVTELRRSLDFFRNRANGLGAQQVILTGGTANVPGLAQFLTANLDVPVAVGNPLQYLSTGPKADPGYLQEVGPVFPVSVGLAVRELLVDNSPKRAKKK